MSVKESRAKPNLIIGIAAAFERAETETGRTALFERHEKSIVTIIFSVIFNVTSEGLCLKGPQEGG
jgi:hypothetical protein